MYDPLMLDAKSPSELIQRREEITRHLSSLPGQYADAPTELLQELAFIYGALRRKTSGPPKVAKATKRSSTPKATVDDLAGMLD